MKLSVTWTF